ncbi:hypothetical protein FQA39_LY08932 [Lamprigera yunnana]|nr:hypothetical protein FQA39_LY08932 [Lamprigera yunnana]
MCNLVKDIESYEDFEEMLLDNYDSKEVWDQLSAQVGRRNKSTTETMAEFLEQKGVLARRLKLDDELHLPQLVDMFGPAVLPYLQALQPVPPTHETREEKIVIPEDNTEVNDIGEMDEEAESHANSEGDELVAAAEEVEILEDETVEEEIIDEVILDKVASVIVGQDLEPLYHAVPVVLGNLLPHGGKQCQQEEVHAQSGTQEASKQNAPRREGEGDALFNRPRHHLTDTKADALRMSDVENRKVRERTRLPPESYEDFEEMLLDNYDSKEVWGQLSAQLGRRNKSTTETMAEFLEQKGVLARRLKLDDELHLPQLVDMFGPAVLPYLQALQPVPPTHETREEKIVIPEDNTEVNDIGEMDEEAESHANSEGDELVAAAEEVEILEDETVEEEIIDEVILDKVASVIVGQDLEPLDHALPVVLGNLLTHGGKQCQQEEVHAQSGTQEASKQNAPRREGEGDALFNRPRHHLTDTKADALRMSDVENRKVRERTRLHPGEKLARNFADNSSRKFNDFHTQRVNHQQERRRLLGRGECYRTTIRNVGGPNPTESAGVLANKKPGKRKFQGEIIEQSPSAGPPQVSQSSSRQRVSLFIVGKHPSAESFTVSDKSSVAEVLTKMDNPANRKRGIYPTKSPVPSRVEVRPPDDVRLDNVGHLPFISDKKSFNRCRK